MTTPQQRPSSDERASISSNPPCGMEANPLTFGDYEVWQGQIFDRDVWRSPDQCARLLSTYRASAEQSDWWAPHARKHANTLEAAMRAAGITLETVQ